jgi:hypothetical protein
LSGRYLLVLASKPQRKGEYDENRICSNLYPTPLRAMIETTLRDNTKVVITEHGINRTVWLGNLPISAPGEKQNGRDLNK